MKTLEVVRDRMDTIGDDELLSEISETKSISQSSHRQPPMRDQDQAEKLYSVSNSAPK